MIALSTGETTLQVRKLRAQQFKEKCIQPTSQLRECKFPAFCQISSALNGYFTSTLEHNTRQQIRTQGFWSHRFRRKLRFKWFTQGDKAGQWPTGTTVTHDWVWTRAGAQSWLSPGDSGFRLVSSPLSEHLDARGPHPSRGLAEQSRWPYSVEHLACHLSQPKLTLPFLWKPSLWDSQWPRAL